MSRAHHFGMSKWDFYQELLKGCNPERRHLLQTTFADNAMPVREWKRRDMELLLGSHLGYKERISFVYICMGNGIAPWHIVLWAKAQAGWLANADAWKHMATLLVDWRDGTFESQGKTGWNMEKREVVPLCTPTFAKETIGRPARDKWGTSLGFWFEPGADFFNDAIKELERISKLGA
tara:strand:- start:61 stop:594 length:534 start_codon:yes stop_codon:yes gene_type:complete